MNLQPFGIVPLWSSRLQADLGVFDDGLSEEHRKWGSMRTT